MVQQLVYQLGISVLYLLTDTSAADDYTPVTQTVTFPAGETSVTVPVNTLDDSIDEQPESFEAQLSDPNGNGLELSIGGEDTATVDIIDDDGEI